MPARRIAYYFRKVVPHGPGWVSRCRIMKVKVLLIALSGMALGLTATPASAWVETHLISDDVRVEVVGDEMRLHPSGCRRRREPESHAAQRDEEHLYLHYPTSAYPTRPMRYNFSKVVGNSSGGHLHSGRDRGRSSR